MSSSPARARRRASSKNGAVAKNGDSAPEQPPQEQPETQGHAVTDPSVVVIRKPNGQGGFQVDFMELNGIDPFAVPSLLRAAANIRENQLGAGGK